MYNTLLRGRLSDRLISGARPGSVMIPRNLFGFLDFLEPLETVWEFYANRDEIFDELVQRGIEFTKRYSVRALGVIFVAFTTAELLARLGILGDKGEGLIPFFQESQTAQNAAEEKVYQKTAGFLADTAVGTFRRYRRWNSKSKFAVAVSVGALFSQTIANVTVFTVKFGLASFLVLETLAMVGVIGEPGESILDWVDNNRDHLSEWERNVKRFRKGFRQRISLKGLEEFYEVAIDEEKVACTGFAIGSIMAMFT